MGNATQISIAQAGDIVEGLEKLPVGREVVLANDDNLGEPICGVDMYALVREDNVGEMLDLTTQIHMGHPLDSVSRRIFQLGAVLETEYKLNYEVPNQPQGPGPLIFHETFYSSERIGGSVTPGRGGKLWMVASGIHDYHGQMFEDLSRAEALWNQHLKVIHGLVEVLGTTLLYDGDQGRDVRMVYAKIPFILEQPELAEPEAVTKTDPFEGFAGIDAIVNELRDMVKLANLSPEMRQHLGVELIQAVLLYGPSGVAKTQLMYALGEALEAEIVDIDYSEVTGTHVGEWARNLEGMFKNAYTNPGRTLIVLDEMDGLVKSGNDDVSANITAVLKKQLERIKLYPHIFLVGATNHIDRIDPVVRASKRIPLQLPISLPDVQERAAIFRQMLVASKISPAHTNGISTDTEELSKVLDLADSYDFDALAASTEEFSGGEIKEILGAIARKRALSDDNEAAHSPITQSEILAAIQVARRTKST